MTKVDLYKNDFSLRPKLTRIVAVQTQTWQTVLRPRSGEWEIVIYSSSCFERSSVGYVSNYTPLPGPTTHCRTSFISSTVYP